MQSLGWTFLAPSLPAAAQRLSVLLPPVGQKPVQQLSARLVQPGKFKGNGPFASKHAVTLFPFFVETKVSCHVVL